MAIPDFQTLMLPLLEQLSDGKEYLFSHLIDLLANRYRLSESERNEMLPSGGARLFDNRIGWARLHLKRAGLIDAPKRAVLKITPRGIEVLNKKPDKLDISYLKQFSEYTEFLSSKKKESIDAKGIEMAEPNQETPLETLENAYLKIRTSLADELLAKVSNMTPVFFERLVVELLVKMGYGGSIADAGKAVGRSGDEGIDGTIKEDKLGLDIIYIQAKRWQKGNTVSRPEIQKFVGALAGQGAKKGIFITTSSFTKDALNYDPKNEIKIVLIDGEQLAQLMIDHNLGVTIQQTYEIKRLDNDYFGDE